MILFIKETLFIYAFSLFQKIGNPVKKFLEIEGPQTRLNSQVQEEDSKDPKYSYIASTVETPLHTRIHTEEPIRDNFNQHEIERIMVENKNKLLVCVDNDSDNEPLKYCFIPKRAVKNSKNYK